MALARLIVLAVLAVDSIRAGGGNAGAPNCWFYKEHFNGSLHSYEQKVKNWQQHILDLEMVYVAKNPLQTARVFNRKLDLVVEENLEMFSSYRRFVIDETAILCGVNDDLIKSALKSFTNLPFPVYCLVNIGEINRFYREALATVEAEKNALKKS